MDRNRTIRVGLLVGALVVGLGFVAFARNKSQENALPAHLTCETEALGETNLRQSDTSYPAVELAKIAEVTDPTDAAMRVGDSATYVSSRSGLVIRVSESGSTDVVLDLGSLDLAQQGGLMAITFDPTGSNLYVSFTRDGINYVDAHPVAEDGAIEGSGATILTLAQPVDIHNFGALVFGPDGYLYIGSGDGGNNTDLPDIREDGQNIETLHGGILRIEPDPVYGGYAIPADNPYIGVDGAAEELWAIGFRNPWRFSFDRATGDLWVGDVGQWCWEEVSHVPFANAGGANFGWSGYEGFHLSAHEPPEDHVFPVFEYLRGDPAVDPIHCAVVGGFVYRGSAIPELVGTYVFADFCAAQVEGLTLYPEGDIGHGSLVRVPGPVRSLAEDPNGELFVLDGSSLYRLIPG